MSPAVAELVKAALNLTVSEREELADAIEASLPPIPEPLHPAWDGELRRRAEELDSGAVEGIPLEEVRQRIREKFDIGNRTDV